MQMSAAAYRWSAVFAKFFEPGAEIAGIRTASMIERTAQATILAISGLFLSV